ncbi:hypothetical protein EV127DRAFT_406667 [Xylaria flabelliformis]|nr:hypothetical protein EV127DRAFT_406667 [Xylaria flabelliformis]KAI0856339.1 hypothetical protein F4860DRAFT_518961 [Xylaria cubensis]
MQFLVTVIATTLLGQASAYYLDKTCSNIEFNPANDVLTLDCNNKQGVPVHQTFDLNTCLGWNAENKAIGYGKNFGNACKDCYTEKRLNEGLEGIYTNIICTCDGIANIVHDLGAESHLGNIDGVLTCCATAC